MSLLGLQWLTSGKQAAVLEMTSCHFSPQVLWNRVAGSAWSSLPFGKCCGLGSMAVWLIDKTMLYCVSWIGCSQPVRATWAWQSIEHSQRKQPCQCAGTCFNSRPWFYTHICSGHMYCDRWKQKWFSLVSVLLDLTSHRNSKEKSGKLKVIWY
jgi:hypothetical protein